MNRQSDFFVNAWKDMAEIDDVLARQAAEAAHRITEIFEQKQQRRPSAVMASSFRLEVIVRKELTVCKKGTTSPYAMLNLSLPTATVHTTKADYLDAVRLLREATDEAMTAQPIVTGVGVRFRWARRFR